MNLSVAAILAQSSSDFGFEGWLFLALIVVFVAGLWRTFTKAGQPGWAAVVPIYNLFVLLRIAQRPAWWFILFLVPVVNIFASIAVGIGVAKAFGKGPGFGIGLAFFGFAFYPILGFSNAEYSAGMEHPEVPSTSFTALPPIPASAEVETASVDSNDSTDSGDASDVPETEAA